MLKRLNEINGFSFHTPEGSIGSCKDTLFDDNRWTVRYLDVDTGNWLPGRRVLLSPISLGEPSWETGEIPTQLSKKQIQDSPSLESHLPVSKTWEDSFFNFHGWPYYGVGMHMWGLTHYPDEDDLKKVHEIQTQPQTLSKRKSNLRSSKELIGYEVSTQDGHLGSVEDYLFDTRSWTIRYLVVKTTQAFEADEIIIAPSWVSNIDWTGRQCVLELTQADIKLSPQVAGQLNDHLDREFELKLHRHYEKPVYWENELR